MIAIFNKENGKFLSFVDIDLDKTEKNPYFVYKDVGEIDPSETTWIGTPDNGQLVNADEELSKVKTEQEIDDLHREFFQKIYNIQTQIEIIVKQLNSMASEKNDDFEKMTRILEESKRINNTYKEAYKKSDRVIYKTYSDIKKEADETFKGGLGEKMLGKHEIDLVPEDEDDKDII